MLFASTVINYIDRQTLSFLSPYLKTEYHWSNTDYAIIAVLFRVAYSLGQMGFGKWIDKVGTRRGLSLTVVYYSIVSILTSLARGFYSFATFRFLLGAGESPNWPAATKAVSEWFPKHERGLATAFYDSGSSIGGAVGSVLIIWIYRHWGWRPAFVIPGVLGFLWLILWRWIYYPPESHPFVSDEERALIAADKLESETQGVGRARPSWKALFKLPQTWGSIIARAFTDPVWFFVTDWFPIYLVTKGFKLETAAIALSVPFVAADFGNFFGGIMSGYLIKRGWSLGAARKAVVIFGGVGVTMLIPTVFTTKLSLIALLVGIAAFCYAAFSTIANVLPGDLYHSESVASVSGIGGSAAGFLTIIAFLFVGHLSDARQGMAGHSFDPIIIVAGIIPFVGMLLVLLLVRNNKATEQGLVKPI